MKFLYRIFFVFHFSIVFLLIILIYFYPIFTSDSICIPFSISHFNICEKYPFEWLWIKRLYIIFSFVLLLFVINRIYSLGLFLLKSIPSSSSNITILEKNFDDLSLFLGKNSENQNINIPISGLYQNSLITGSIGSGKTSSLLYPLTEQLLSFNFSHKHESAFLILDVKGNYHKFVKTICMKNKHIRDLFIISLNGSVTYNPLDKPNLKPHVLANRLKNILLLFSPQQTESFWLDKAEQILAETIKLCRIYNDGYVTFTEIHKIIMDASYYQEKIDYLRNLFYKNLLDSVQIQDLISCISFFDKEFLSLDERTLSILRSEISRITNIFVSDADVSKIFCPDKRNISFPGFKYLLKNHKILVLDMNISMYSSLSKFIAAYLKIDFQSEVLQQLSELETPYPSCFICDEYHEYVTKNDVDFFAQSREAKCINIVATQSYSSLLNSIKDKVCTNVLIQNLVNKFWFRTDDSFTIEEILKQTGKENKTITSHSISENARQTTYNPFFNSFFSKDSNISESINTSYQKDFIFDSSFFTRNLSTFSCLAFLSTGSSILPLQNLSLVPYFKRKDVI